MRAPSLLSIDEGRWGRSDRPTQEDRSARRGSGRSTYARGDWQHGRPVARPGRSPGTGPFGGRARQASEGPIVPSEGPIVPMKLGNASGGKGPWWGGCWNDPRGGDWREPGNPRETPEAPTGAPRTRAPSLHWRYP